MSSKAMTLEITTCFATVKCLFSSTTLYGLISQRIARRCPARCRGMRSRSTHGRSNMLRLTIAALVLIVGSIALSARATIIFRDDFNSPTLDPAWSVHPGAGSYSLTESPGNLRYDLNSPSIPPDTNQLWIYRQLSGTNWVFH